LLTFAVASSVRETAESSSAIRSCPVASSIASDTRKASRNTIVPVSR